MADTVEVRLTEAGPLRVRGNGITWERGETRTLAPDQAEVLAERDGFEIVDGGDSGADRDDDTETCDVVMDSGEVCGRERPCQYDDETEG